MKTTVFLTVLLLLNAGPAQADETSLVWSTFLGGVDYDRGYSIAVDTEGHAYVTGTTWSGDFPITAGAYDESHSDYSDAFVIKVNRSGSTLDYATFLGGGDDEIGYGIAVDDLGYTYVTGWTRSIDFPNTSAAVDMKALGSEDVFITKVEPTGEGIVYSTLFGGSDDDHAYDIAIDSAGNSYVVGKTLSEDFPATAGAYDVTYNDVGFEDAFVAKLNAGGSDLVYSTFLGGNLYDRAYGIAVDEYGHVYTTGWTLGEGFPATTGAYDISHNGTRDVFVTKLNAAGSDLEYSTFLGGDAEEWGNGIAIDEDGNAYINGRTCGADFPSTPGSYSPAYNGGGADVFVAKLNATGSDLIYSTFLGGSGAEGGERGTAVDDAGNVYVNGFTNSPDFPTTTDAYDLTYNGRSDIFTAILNADGNDLLYSSFLGGSDDEWGQGITSLARDDSVHLFVTGYTGSVNFPTTAGAYDPDFNGREDVIVAEFILGSGTAVLPQVSGDGMPGTYTLRQNYPNPFNACTAIEYQILNDHHVLMSVFNTLGQEVRVLVDADQERGEYSIFWDGKDNLGREMASGLYFCRLQAGGAHRNIKMVLVR